MNQSVYLSRSALKDKAKGALNGHYRKLILATFLLTGINLSVTFAIEYILSFFIGMATSFGMISSGSFTPGMSEADLTALTQTILASSQSLSVAATTQAISYLLSFVASVFIYMMNIGLTMMFLKIACGGSCAVSDLFSCFRHHFSTCLRLALCMTLIQQLLLLPQTLLLFFVNYTDSSLCTAITAICMIPANILYLLLSLTYSQSCYLHLDFPEYSCSKVMKLSRQMMKGHKMRYFLLELSFIPLILLNALTFGIGNLWLLPYQQMTLVFFYLNLVQNTRVNTHGN